MLLPVFLKLEGQDCLVVGGGSVGVRKAESLLSCGAAVTVVARDIDGKMPVGIRVEKRDFEDGDIAGKSLVVSATDDRDENARIAKICRENNIPVNVVDSPEDCSFFFPAVLRKGPMTIAVSSDGNSPVAAQIVRDRAERLLSDDFIAAVEQLGKEREELKARYPLMQDRKRHCEEVLKRWKD